MSYYVIKGIAMKANNYKTALFQSVNRYDIGLFLIIFVCLLSACNPVFELQINVQDQPLSVLGKIAYISGGDVWVNDLDNDQTTRLTQDGYNSHPLWSADGFQIAFLKKNQLWVINSVSHQAMLISETPVDWFKWSPKGAKLAYFLSNVGLFTWDMSQQAGKILLPITQGNTLESFIWNNNESIVFTNGSIKNGNYWLTIDRVRIGDGVVQPLYETPELRKVPRLASVSADGQWIIFWLWDTRITFPEQEGLLLCTLSVADKQIRCVDSKTIPSNDFLDWSSGNRVAFISTTTEENRFKNSLIIADSSEFKENPLVEYGAGQLSIHPAWAPDGNSIAYSGTPEIPQKTLETYEQNGISICNRGIWVVDTESKKSRQLTDDERYCDDIPEWSADGKYILFFRVDNNNASLWLMKSNGNDLHQVVPELTPKPELLGEYGFINWASWWDWWHPTTP
jgi:dipeptidyl aminopeptidase/acylaminoacyl peptidase